MENKATWLTGISLGLLFGSPWLIASIYYWRRSIRDGATPPSLGEQLRDRLLR
jgi:integral membrane sensor domain MASE1